MEIPWEGGLLFGGREHFGGWRANDPSSRAKDTRPRIVETPSVGWRFLAGGFCFYSGGMGTMV